MADCNIQGNGDMYGLGIRVGFYLQWLASPLAAWLAQDEVAGLRTANAFFVAATFLGLIIETARDGIDIAEIYIILMLTFGAQLFLLPLMIWRIVTRYDAKWDPTRFAKSPPPSKTFWLLNSLIQIGEIIYQLWFWIYKVPRAPSDCDRFGFAFAKVRLNGNGFRIFNIVFMCLLLALFSFFFLKHAQFLWKEWQNARPKKITINGIVTSTTTVEFNIPQGKQENVKEGRKKLFQIIESALRLASIAVVILATELTIFWNGIQEVNDPSSVGQLIPLVLGVGAVGHLLLSTCRARIPDPIKAKESEMGVIVQRDPFDMTGISRIGAEEHFVIPVDAGQNEAGRLSKSTGHDKDKDENEAQ